MLNGTYIFKLALTKRRLTLVTSYLWITSKYVDDSLHLTMSGFQLVTAMTTGTKLHSLCVLCIVYLICFPEVFYWCLIAMTWSVQIKTDQFCNYLANYRLHCFVLKADVYNYVFLQVNPRNDGRRTRRMGNRFGKYGSTIICSPQRRL